MEDRPPLVSKVSSVLIVALIALAGVLGTIALFAAPTRAGPCDQVSGVITGDWVVSTTQVCSGILYVVDGSITVTSTGNLTLVNGGLKFVQDSTHRYALTVDSGGVLILDDSIVTTEPRSLSAILKLPFTVNGRLTMVNGAELKFPGWLNASSATITIRSSTITGWNTADVTPWFPSSADDNDDAPQMTFSSSTVSMFDSTITRLYENVTAIAPSPMMAITLAGSTTFTAVNSYIGVDFHPDTAKFHNELRAEGTSRAFLLGVTIDQNQSDLVAPGDWIPAYVATSSGTIQIYRWLNALVTDSTGLPVSGASIWSRRSPSSATVSYPDNPTPPSLCPGTDILNYLQKTCGNFNVTGEDGRALIPLFTEQVDASTMPNAESFGNFALDARRDPYTSSGGVSFDAYPIITVASNTESVTVPITGLTLPRPELTIDTVLFFRGTTQTSDVPVNVPINITATVNNSGSVQAQNVVVSFFLTDVDSDRDGRMDVTKDEFNTSGVWLGDITLPLVAPTTTAVAWLMWTPAGDTEVNRPISVVVDTPPGDPLGNGAVSELTETNNIYTISVLVHAWPDLSVDASEVTFPTGLPIVSNPTPIDVRVRNLGTADAVGATVAVYEGGTAVSQPVSFDVARGASAVVRVSWTPSAAGSQAIGIFVSARNDTVRNTDYAQANNLVSITQTVQTQPNLEVRDSDYAPITRTRGVVFGLNVILYNLGDTIAENLTVSIFLDGDPTMIVGRTDGVSVAGGGEATVTILVTVNEVLTHDLTIYADSHSSGGTLAVGTGRIIEGNEANNWANVTALIEPPAGQLVINAPASSGPFQPATFLNVQGFVTDTSGSPIPGLPIIVDLVDGGGNLVTTQTTTSEETGLWRVTLDIPETLLDGTYTIRVTVPASTITETMQVQIERPKSFLFMPFLGLPMLIWLIIAIVAAGIVIGVTLYFRVYGLGKMVECGECGSFIPEDSTKCPKCGVEFEKDMAKCSNCQAWIPIYVKQCPECGVEFATGKVEMADYREKMRMQYDEVVAKFREEAHRTLGRTLTEAEFEDWWRKQPTFVTFEDWLREEEEMRKMGSKPCPSCGTLNSVTGTVCHKCGTYLKEGKPSSSDAPRGGPPGGAPPAEPSLQKVIRKAGPGPVVQKKVIKRPAAEQGTTESQSAPADEEF